MAVFLFCALVALQLADAASTIYIIRRGIGVEANPAMRWVIAKIGAVAGLLLPKMAVMLLAYLFVLGSGYAIYALSALISLARETSMIIFLREFTSSR